MDFCDYGSLVRPIMKGMFRPFSASGSDREARVRYRALLRTAKEIAQVSVSGGMTSTSPHIAGWLIARVGEQVIAHQ
jgi:hypothetical protein